MPVYRWPVGHRGGGRRAKGIWHLQGGLRVTGVEWGIRYDDAPPEAGRHCPQRRIDLRRAAVAPAQVPLPARHM